MAVLPSFWLSALESAYKYFDCSHSTTCWCLATERPRQLDLRGTVPSQAYVHKNTTTSSMQRHDSCREPAVTLHVVKPVVAGSVAHSPEPKLGCVGSRTVPVRDVDGPGVLWWPRATCAATKHRIASRGPTQPPYVNACAASVYCWGRADNRHPSKLCPQIRRVRTPLTVG